MHGGFRTRKVCWRTAKGQKYAPIMPGDVQVIVCVHGLDFGWEARARDHLTKVLDTDRRGRVGRARGGTCRAACTQEYQRQSCSHSDLPGEVGGAWVNVFAGYDTRWRERLATSVQSEEPV